jgi:hypothetical protein
VTYIKVPDYREIARIAEREAGRPIPGDCVQGVRAEFGGPQVIRGVLARYVHSISFAYGEIDQAAIELWGRNRAGQPEYQTFGCPADSLRRIEIEDLPADVRDIYRQRAAEIIARQG